MESADMQDNIYTVLLMYLTIQIVGDRISFCWHVCLSVCFVFVCLSVCLFVCLSVCVFVYLFCACICICLLCVYLPNGRTGTFARSRPDRKCRCPRRAIRATVFVFIFFIYHQWDGALCTLLICKRGRVLGLIVLTADERLLGKYK